MKSLRHKFKKLINKIGHYLMIKSKPDHPFSEQPIANEEKFLNLAKEARSKVYEEIDAYELQTGFSIDKDWFHDLALHTQVTKKKTGTEPEYVHGRVLYSTLRVYLKEQELSKNDRVTIVETGTARGFSALCMAKALEDSNSSGSILTFDLISNETKMYWNCIDDLRGKNTRFELLKNWKNLVTNYLIFIEGDTKMTLQSTSVMRINFAFLDGAHTFNDVMYEFSTIKDKQYKGDIVVYDDYNFEKFPGIVKAVDEICSTQGYSRIDLKSPTGRGYVVATKIE